MFAILFCYQIYSFFFLTGSSDSVQELPLFQLKVYTYVCDVGKRESVYSTAEKVRKEVGNIDLLINNAGVVSGRHLLECPDELIERTMMVNCHAHFWVSMWLWSAPLMSSFYIYTFLCVCVCVFIFWFCIHLYSQTTKAFLPKMLELNHGHIVTVASSLGLFTTAGVEVKRKVSLFSSCI